MLHISVDIDPSLRRKLPPFFGEFDPGVKMAETL